MGQSWRRQLVAAIITLLLVVAVWKFDRFARSVSHLLRALDTFRVLGIEFVSLSESLDTATPAGRMVWRRAKSQALPMKVEQLTERLRRLVLERQSLRDRGASTADLERNRLEIVRRQWELSHALIESHNPEPLPLPQAA